MALSTYSFSLVKYVRKITDVEAKWGFVRINEGFRKMFPVNAFTLIFNDTKYLQTIDKQCRMWVRKISNLKIKSGSTIEIIPNNDDTFTLNRVRT